MPRPSRGRWAPGAGILSIGIASTGVLTFAYFSVASYVLDDVHYKAISLVWSILFVTVSIVHRPIEQLLARTIAARRARGFDAGHPLRSPLLIQAGFAAAFIVLALAARRPLEYDVLEAAPTLYWVLIASVLAYAASYVARGWLAGHQWFALYGGLVLVESLSRLLFALAVAAGIASGAFAVGLGMAAAPLVSLIVVPLALSHRPRATPRGNGRDALAIGGGARFAVAVLAVMLAEQTLLNAGVLTVDAGSSPGSPVAGYVFNVLLIARAPLQLFQAVQGSLLPHLAGLAATGHDAELDRAVRDTLLAVAAFAGSVAVGLLALGPSTMHALFDDHAHYERIGLAAVGLGMGAHLAAGTLNQAALARDRAAGAAGAWLAGAAMFLLWLLVRVVGDPVLRVELGYLGAALLVCAMLAAVHRRAPAALARV